MSNKTNKLLIVGDKLTNFSKEMGAMSISNLEKFIAANENSLRENIKIEVLLGQGISDKKLHQLGECIDKFKLNKKIIIKSQAENCKRSVNKLVHKRLNKNSMISDPIKVTDQIFESLLMIDDRCAEMSDHVTGLHIQGMVLIEAARQMTIAITEKYFLSEKNQGKMYFVTNTLETKFNQFIFPVDVKIEYKILEKRGLVNGNQSFKVAVSFIQNNQIGTEVIYKFSVFEPKFIKEKEHKLAMDQVNSCLKQ